MYIEYNYKYMSTIKILLYNKNTLIQVCILNIENKYVFFK